MTPKNVSAAPAIFSSHALDFFTEGDLAAFLIAVRAFFSGAARLDTGSACQAVPVRLVMGWPRRWVWAGFCKGGAVVRSFFPSSAKSLMNSIIRAIGQAFTTKRKMISAQGNQLSSLFLFFWSAIAHSPSFFSFSFRL